MEQITIVDKEDNVIGYKNRGDLLDSDIYRVSALWIVNSKNQTLLAQRSYHKDKDPGMWGPAVAGTVAKDETYEENIYKEAKEELGIDARGFILGPKKLMNFSPAYFTQWFICTLEKSAREFVVKPDEVAQVAWFDLDELFDDIDNNPDKFIRGANTWRGLFTNIS